MLIATSAVGTPALELKEKKNDNHIYHLLHKITREEILGMPGGGGGDWGLRDKNSGFPSLI